MLNICVFLLLFGVSQPLATYNLCFVEKSSLDVSQ